MDLYLCYTTQHASNSDESRDKSPCPRGPQPTTFFNTDCLPSFEVTPATLSQMPSPGNSPLVLSALNSSASEAAGSGYSSTSSEGTPCLTVDPRQLFNPNRRIEQDPILPPPPYRDPNAPLVDLPFMDPSLEQCDWQGYLPPVPDHWMGEELSERKIASWRSPGEFIHICQVTGCNYMNFNPSLFRTHQRQVHRKPASCTFCNKRFGTSRDLNRHVVSNHKKQAAKKGLIAAFQCHVEPCEYSTNRKDNLKRHVRTRHKYGELGCQIA